MKPPAILALDVLDLPSECEHEWGPLPADRRWCGAAVYGPGRDAKGELDTRAYRYLLARYLDEPAFGNERVLVNCLINPSVATAFEDDNTIRRMKTAAFALGFNALIVVNLFALRSKKPSGLAKVNDPVGPYNDIVLRWAAELAVRSGGRMVCGWGANVEAKTAWQARARDTARILLPYEPHVWTVTDSGHPGHPLYLPNPLTPIPWVGAAEYANHQEPRP